METNVMMPAGKVEDLYNTLSIVSTRIYIQRSKLMREQGTRTRLFAWLVSDLQLLALADPTIHGPDNVVDNMTQIDPESWVDFYRMIIVKENEISLECTKSCKYLFLKNHSYIL